MEVKEIKVINLNNSYCYRCGKIFGQEGIEKTKHHSIPRALNPRLNITIPLCRNCHNELNNLYINQEKRKKAPKPYKYFANKMEGLLKSYSKFEDKLKKLHTEMVSEIKKIEEIKKDN